MKSHDFSGFGARLRNELERHERVDRPSESHIRKQILSAASQRRGSRRALYGTGAGLFVAAAAAGIIFLARPHLPEHELSFWVAERQGQVDEWVTAREAEQSLRFSDGTSIVAAPHTTTRVVRIAPNGAELTLERGQLDAHVVHREAARWQVSAGPFVVHVTGTRFHVSWDPQAEKLGVQVTEGRVEITGGGQPRHELVAGSTLELRMSAGVSLSSAIELPPAATASPMPATSAQGTSTDHDDELRPRKAADHKPDFRDLATAGHYRDALALVEQRGFAAECDSLSARDLLTLASTARLAGRADRAREAYLAVRRRFPSSSEASISAFSLGRLASDAGRASDAVTWWKRYLAEAPNGPLAREAAGRLVEVWQQLGNKDAARSAAESYLKSYPSGPHAGLSRSVLAPQ